MLLVLKSKKKNFPRMMNFLKKLEKRLKNKGCQMDFSSFEDIEVFLEKGSVKMLIKGKPLETWSTIYPRKVASYKGLAFMLAHLAKEKNIYFLDKYHENSKDSSDSAKMIQMFRLGTSGVSIPKTYYSAIYLKQHIKKAISFLKLPVVVKECNTSGGEGVFLAKSASALEKTIKSLLKKFDKKEIFLQEFIPNDFEYRVMITGDKVAVVEKKFKNEKEEFRNNVRLGAKEEFIKESQVSSEVKKAALLAAKVTGIEVAGVDIVERKNGQPVVFEVNACPAFTLNEEVSDEISLLADYLSKCEKKRNS
jgi:glutathione synthase/RimK-type ligase-like ATP-grasp enzyme